MQGINLLLLAPWDMQKDNGDTPHFWHLGMPQAQRNWWDQILIFSNMRCARSMQNTQRAGDLFKRLVIPRHCHTQQVSLPVERGVVHEEGDVVFSLGVSGL